MVMKKCPSDEILATLGAGRLDSRKRQMLLAHAVGCPRCAPKVRRIARLTEMLHSAQRQSDGSIALEVPEPRVEFSHDLNAAVQRQFEGKRRWLQKLRSLVSELFRDAQTDAEEMVQPAALGSRAAARPKPIASPSAAAALAGKLSELLATLLDADLALDIRLKWAGEVKQRLFELRSEHDQSDAPSRRSRKGRRKTTPQRKPKPS